MNARELALAHLGREAATEYARLVEAISWLFTPEELRAERRRLDGWRIRRAAALAPQHRLKVRRA